MACDCKERLDALEHRLEALERSTDTVAESLNMAMPGVVEAAKKLAAFGVRRVCDRSYEQMLANHYNGLDPNRDPKREPLAAVKDKPWYVHPPRCECGECKK